MLKAAIKHSAGEDQVRHRLVPPEAMSKWVEKLESIKDEVSEILVEEKEEKEVGNLLVSGRPLLNVTFFSSAGPRWS